MKKYAQVGAVLLMMALLVCIAMPAAAFDTHSAVAHHSDGGAALKWFFGGVSLFGLAGTVVLTYLTPSLGPGAPTITLGGTVPPTAAQSANINVLGVEVSTGDTDTSVAIVHNWGLSTADINAGLPLVNVGLVTAGTLAAVFTGLVSGSAANTLTITKANAAGSGSTALFILQRPSTLIR